MSAEFSRGQQDAVDFLERFHDRARHEEVEHQSYGLCEDCSKRILLRPRSIGSLPTCKRLGSDACRVEDRFDPGMLTKRYFVCHPCFWMVVR